MVKEQRHKAGPKVYLAFKSLVQHVPHLIKDLKKQTLLFSLSDEMT